MRKCRPFDVVRTVEQHFVLTVAIEVDAEDLGDFDFRIAQAFRCEEFADGFDVSGLRGGLGFWDAGRRVPFASNCEDARGWFGSQRDDLCFDARFAGGFGLAAGHAAETLGDAVEAVFFAAFDEVLRFRGSGPLSSTRAAKQEPGFRFDDGMKIRSETRRGEERK